MPVLQEEEKEEDGEEEDDDDEGKIEGKRKYEGDMQNSLVVEKGMMVQFPLHPFATCLLPLQLLPQGSLQCGCLTSSSKTMN